MTDRYVNPAVGSSGTGGSWAQAYKTLKEATDAAAAGEPIYFATGTADVITADTTYTLAAGVRVISTSDTSNEPPTTYATGATVSTTTSSVEAIFNGIGALYGLTFTIGDGSDDSRVYISNADGSEIVCEDCTFSIGGTSTTAHVRVGGIADNTNTYAEFRRCNFSWASNSQGITLYSTARFIDCDMSSGSTHPLTIIEVIGYQGLYVQLIGCDMSDSDSIFATGPSTYFVGELKHCKLKASATIFAPAAAVNGEAWVFDCDDGDSHIEIAHYNYWGSTIISGSIYATDNIGDSNLSWVVDGSNATKANPYYSPWISAYHTGTSEITPYLECVRDGSATAYNEDQVWVEFLVKDVTNTTRANLYTNRSGPLTTGAANTNSSKGAGDWTGENATAWFGKLALNDPVTPTDPGYISARVGVAGDYTVYVDPQIRGLS